MRKDSRELSKQGWDCQSTLEAINTGSLQRIADATEKMAANYSQLITERDRYKLWYEQQRERVQATYRSMTALRGVITKLKNKLNK